MRCSDITPYERALLARLRFCPQTLLGEKSLRNFRHMSGGYQFAMQTAGLRAQHNLIPEGLDEFTAEYLNLSSGSWDCFTMIAQVQPDDEKALGLFFRVLDAYLERAGLEPLPEVRNWQEFRALWEE